MSLKQRVGRNYQAQDGAKNVAVGKIIALLAEEGDDISNLEVPKEEPAAPKEVSPPTPAPASTQTPGQSPPQPPQSSSSSHSHVDIQHDRPLFPSVHRLLLEHASTIPKPSSIKGTGVRGMLTKGDVLAFLGRASGPLGTYAGKEVVSEMKALAAAGGKPPAKEAPKVISSFLQY